MGVRHEAARVFSGGGGVKIDFPHIYRMKQLIITITAALCLCSAQAALVSSNLLTLATVNSSTNTGSAVSLGNVYIPATTFSVQSIGVGGTNGPGGRIYVGLSTNTAYKIQVGTVTVTNDTVQSVTLTNSAIPIYVFFEAYNTTNTAVQVGAQSIQSR